MEMNKPDLEKCLFGEADNNSASSHSPDPPNNHNINDNLQQQKRIYDRSNVDQKYQQQQQQIFNNTYNAQQHQPQQYTPNRSFTYGSNKTCDELQEIIEKIQCPMDDLSLTTFTNSTHSNISSTPNRVELEEGYSPSQIQQKSNHKYNNGPNSQRGQDQRYPPINNAQYQRQIYSTTSMMPINGVKSNQQQYQLSQQNQQQFLQQYQNLQQQQELQRVSSNKTTQPQYMNQKQLPNLDESESLTSSKIKNKMQDWTKEHIIPGESKHLFPAVCAPSIEQSNENSVVLKQIQDQNLGNDNRHIVHKRSNGAMSSRVGSKANIPDNIYAKNYLVSQQQFSNASQSIHPINQMLYTHNNNKQNLATFGNFDTKPGEETLTDDRIEFLFEKRNTMATVSSNSNSMNVSQLNNNGTNNNQVNTMRDSNISSVQQQQQIQQQNNYTPQGMNYSNNTNIQAGLSASQISSQHMNNMQQQNDSINNTDNKKADNYNGDLLDQNSQFYQNQSQMQQQSQHFQNQLERVVQEKETVERQLEGVLEQLKKSDQEKCYLGQRISELEEQLKFLQEKHKDPSSLELLRGRELEQEKIKNMHLRTSNDGKNEKISKLQQQLTSQQKIEQQVKQQLELKIEELEQQIAQLQKYSEESIMNLNQTIQNLENENNELRQESEQKDQFIDDLKEKILNLEEANHQLNVQINNSINSAASNAIQRNNFEDIQHTYQLREKLMNDEINKMKIQYEQELQKLKDELSKKYNSNGTQQTNNTTNSTKDSNPNSSETSFGEAVLLSKKLLQQQTCQCKDQIKKVLEELDIVSMANINIKEQQQIFMGNSASAQTIQIACTSIIEKFKQIRSDHEQVDKDLRELVKKEIIYNNEVKTLKGENDLLKEQINSYSKFEGERKNQMEQLLKEQINRIDDKMKAERIEYEKNLREYKKENESLLNRVENQEKEKIKQSTELQKEIEQLKQQNQKLNAQKQSQKQQQQNIYSSKPNFYQQQQQNILFSSQQQQDDLNIRNSINSLNIQDSPIMMEQFSQIQQQSQQLSNKNCQQQQNLIEQVQYAKEQLDLTKRELEYYKHLTEGREKEVEELRNQQSSYEEECRLLRRELETVRITNSNLDQNVKERIQETQDLHNKQNNLEEKLEKTARSVKEKERKITQLIKENQELAINVARLENDLENNKNCIEIKNAELKGQLESCRQLSLKNSQLSKHMSDLNKQIECLEKEVGENKRSCSPFSRKDNISAYTMDDITNTGRGTGSIKKSVNNNLKQKSIAVSTYFDNNNNNNNNCDRTNNNSNCSQNDSDQKIQKQLRPQRQSKLLHKASQTSLSSVDLQQQKLNSEPQLDNEVSPRGGKQKIIREMSVDSSKQIIKQQFIDNIYCRFKNICEEFLKQNNEFQKMRQIFLKKVISMSEKLSKMERANKKLETDYSVLTDEKKELLITNKVLNEKIDSIIKQQQVVQTSLCQHQQQQSPNLLYPGMTLATSKSISASSQNVFENYDQQQQTTGCSEHRTNNNNNSLYNSILDMFSPEMLSIEETIYLLIEILRRIVNSAQMKKSIVSNSEFVKLTQLVNSINEGGSSAAFEHNNGNINIYYSGSNNVVLAERQKAQQQQQILQKRKMQSVYIMQQQQIKAQQLNNSKSINIEKDATQKLLADEQEESEDLKNIRKQLFRNEQQANQVKNQNIFAKSQNGPQSSNNQGIIVAQKKKQLTYTFNNVDKSNINKI